MASLAVLCASCQSNQDTPSQPPINKPEIQIQDGKLTAEALWAMGRIGSVTINEATGNIAYTVSYYSVSENRSTTWIRIMDNSGQEIIDEFVGSEPAWLDQTDALVYLKGGKMLVRQDKQDIVLSGTDLSIEGFLISPTKENIVLITQVKTVESTADKYPDLALASGRIVDDLMYKHWDEWTETAPQPFVHNMNIDYKHGKIISISVSHPINILEGTPYESPMKPFGGVEQLAWSPDGKTLAYTCRKKAGLEYAISTNSDIYLYDIKSKTHSNITDNMMGYDTNPSFSQDGKHIAWLSMERDGYESDENRLFVLDLTTGQKTFVTQGLNTNVDAYYWKDNEHIVFSACWHATVQLYETNLSGERKQLTQGQYDHVPVATIGDQLYYLRHSMREANELFVNNSQITFENKNIYDQITMGTVEPIWQKTSDGQQMLTWIIYPPHFDPNRKYPTLLYCEGGPQSPVSQFWSFRWNFMMMAAHDYIIVAPNRRGLPGFGKEWNEQISGDYGGQCMKDYLAAIDQFAASNTFVDQDRLGCVGASFGGFSVYWLAGHHNKRFKAFIAHDGIFNMEMQYLETEEKWFANWDMGGAYWEKNNPIAQRTFANSPHKFVDKWDTPILCIHGEKDYRILANQSMAAFDAAKMRGIPAQLLIFPDENHWVLKPQNGILWQRTFFNWLDKWLKQ